MSKLVPGILGSLSVLPVWSGSNEEGAKLES